MSLESLPIPDNIADLTGPLILGHFFNWGLLGVLTVQAYIYYLVFPGDAIWPTKSLAAFVYILEVAQTCIVTSDAFRNFGSGWGDMVKLDLIGTYWLGLPVMTAIISCVVQFVYAWRVWRLTKRWWTPGIIALLSLTQGIAGIYAGDRARRLNHFSMLQADTYVSTSIWLAGTASCDTLIAASMSLTLLKSRTGMRQTNILLSRIVRLVVETGTVCAVCAVLDLILYLVFMHNNYHLAPSITLTKVYSNSLFAILNSRLRVVNGKIGQYADSADTTLSIHVSSEHPRISRGHMGAYSQEAVQRVELAEMPSNEGIDLGRRNEDPKTVHLGDSFEGF